jgi:hypothetical protein
LITGTTASKAHSDKWTINFALIGDPVSARPVIPEVAGKTSDIAPKFNRFCDQIYVLFIKKLPQKGVSFVLKNMHFQNN